MKRVRVALLMYYAFTWPSLKIEISSLKVQFRSVHIFDHTKIKEKLVKNTL